MWHFLWIPVLIPTFIIKSNCDNNRTHSDVYIQYAGHAEVDNLDTMPVIAKKSTTSTSGQTTQSTVSALRTTVLETAAHSTEITHESTVPSTAKSTVPSIVKSTTPTTIKSTTPLLISNEQSDPIIFIPDDNVMAGANDGYVDGVKINDLMMMKPELMAKKFHDDKQLNGKNDDIVFVVGKNGEPERDRKPKTRNSNQVEDYEESEPKLPPPKPGFSCNNLYCNNTIKSICGAKVADHGLKYRLFLNECYFRKVNCGFRYSINKYKTVSLDKCKSVARHYGADQFSFQPRYYNFQKPDPRRNGGQGHASRRAMAMLSNGEMCSHPCPVTCPEHYDPECAVSSTGQKRVFMNHCKLDHNSCFFGVVWHKKHLAECVGAEKAELRQNRGFIGWMQRVGIVDGRGRLVLD